MINICKKLLVWPFLVPIILLAVFIFCLQWIFDDDPDFHKIFYPILYPMIEWAEE